MSGEYKAGTESFEGRAFLNLLPLRESDPKGRSTFQQEFVCKLFFHHKNVMILLVFNLLREPIVFVMERKMMMGIKERAEMGTIGQGSTLYEK